MRDAIILSTDGTNTAITAGPVLVVQDKCPNAPATATRPECSGTVTLRKRKRMDGTITWFYRHTSTSSNDDCPRRYRPT